MKDGERVYKLNQCDKGWFTLKKIEGETEKRYCETCDKCVHWCNTEADIQDAVNNKWCIATENRLVYTSFHPQSVDYKPRKHSYVGGVENLNYLPKIRVGGVESSYNPKAGGEKFGDDDFGDFKDFEV